MARKKVRRARSSVGGAGRVSKSPGLPVRNVSSAGARIRIAADVNGETYTREVEPRTLLVDFLRDDLRLTGTHIGCDTTHCGACTVLVDGAAIKSCTMLAVQADGTSITTIEGLAENGHLDSLQRAFKEYHGLQCGFCTPGVVLAAKELLRLNPHPSEEDIREGISGNLCRCTGYVNIVRAVVAAAKSSR